jgi:transposase
VLELPGNNNAAVTQIFLSLIDEAFRAHESWRKTRDLLTYHSWANDFKIRLNLALGTWLNLVGYAAGLLLKSLRDKAEQWWYFLNDPSVPPDNNLAERSLRPSVTKRKVSGGSRSMKRFEETANLLSVIQTCRFQARSVMAFFREAISAHSCDLAIMPLAHSPFSDLNPYKQVNPQNNKLLILLMDRGGWHTTKKLKGLNNIIIYPIPAYTPKLNPTECIWPLIRECLANNTPDSF